MFRLPPVRLWRIISLVLLMLSIVFTLTGTFFIQGEIVIHIIVYPYKSFEKTPGQQSFKRRDVMRAFFRSGYDLDGNGDDIGDISFLSF